MKAMTETGVDLRKSAFQITIFFSVCAVVAWLLSLGEFLGGPGGGRMGELAQGTDGYIGQLKIAPYVLVVAFILLEYLVLKVQRKANVYDWKDSIASYAIYLFNGLIAPLTLIYQFFILQLLEPYAIFQIDGGLIPFLVTFILAEGAYYWYHRLSHEVPLLWAIHHTHHSAQTLNLSIAFRLHTLGRVISPVIYLPMVLFGFRPGYILAALALSLIYQFFIHTQTIGKLWILENTGFNTPSLHRVHHGTNDWCIDKNYAGVLILWDKIFGTFQREIGEINYGVTTGHYSYNPVKVMLGPLHDWWRGDFAREKVYARLAREGRLKESKS